MTGLLMTAGLLGFAASGFIPEGDPLRTLRLAVAGVLAFSVLALVSPNFAILIAARLGQGVGVGLLVGGGLADIARRSAPGTAGRFTGSMIAGTAIGGLLSRMTGYSALFLGWRAAFAIGGLATLVIAGLAVRSLPREPASGHPTAGRATSPIPWRLVGAGLGILFVNIAVFDLLPYRLEGSPFNLPPTLADLVYLAFIPAMVAATAAGRAVDRLGARAVVLITCVAGVGLILASLIPSVWTVGLAAVGSISGAVALHVAHSGAAASHGRAAVSRYLTAYYVGGALAAPLAAAAFGAAGWSGAILPICSAWLLVAGLALFSPRSQWQGEAGRVPAST